jgi:hypothetical protein
MYKMIMGLPGNAEAFILARIYFLFSSGNGPFSYPLLQFADLIVRRKGLRLQSNP